MCNVFISALHDDNAELDMLVPASPGKDAGLDHYML